MLRDIEGGREEAPPGRPLQHGHGRADRSSEPSVAPRDAEAMGVTGTLIPFERDEWLEWLVWL